MSRHIIIEEFEKQLNVHYLLECSTSGYESPIPYIQSCQPKLYWHDWDLESDFIKVHQKSELFQQSDLSFKIE